MTDRQASEILMRDMLVGEFSPPASALRALRTRRRRQQLARTGLAAVVLLSLTLFAARTFQRESALAVPTPRPPAWLVRTQDLPNSDVVRTAPVAVVVNTPTNLPQNLVVYTRSGLYAPLSDEGLLALLADRSPALIGSPGDRRLIFLNDDLRQ